MQENISQTYLIKKSSEEKQIHRYLAKWSNSREAPTIKLQERKGHQPAQQDHNPCCLIAAINNTKYKQLAKNDNSLDYAIGTKMSNFDGMRSTTHTFSTSIYAHYPLDKIELFGHASPESSPDRTCVCS